jgi:hypothetical protein
MRGADAAVGDRRPSVSTRFKKGRSGDPHLLCCLFPILFILSCPDKLRAQKSIQLEAKPSAILSPIESKGCILHAAVRIMVGSCAAVGLWEIEILSGPCHRSRANDAVLSEARIRHEMPLGTTLWCASIKPPTVQAFRRVLWLASHTRSKLSGIQCALRAWLGFRSTSATPSRGDRYRSPPIFQCRKSCEFPLLV